MNLHEYQAKQLFNRYGIATPHGEVAHDAETAMQVVKRLGGQRWVVKAQVHSGGRGKAGGVKVTDSEAEAVQTAKSLIGQSLVTQQTTALGLTEKKVLIEQPSSIAREIYLALVVDRVSQRVTFMVSAQGGMDIE